MIRRPERAKKFIRNSFHVLKPDEQNKMEFHLISFSSLGNLICLINGSDEVGKICRSHTV